MYIIQMNYFGKLNEIIEETAVISNKISHLVSIRSLQISTLSLEETLKGK